MKRFFWRVSQGMFLWLMGCFSHGVAADTILETGTYYTTANTMTVPTGINAGKISSPPPPATALSGGGTTQATTIFDFADSHLNISTSQARTGSVFNLSESNGDIPFTVNADTHYSLSGFFKVNDLVDATPGTSQLFVVLHDDTDDADLFRSNQITSSVSDASYTLGDSFGVVFRSGDLTGTLLAGHEYTFTTALYTQATNPLGDGGATANGFVSLAIVETPEPGIAWAGGALLLVLAGNRILCRRLNVSSPSR